MKGTVQGLGAEEQALVDLARGCDSFQVQVCPGIHGSALYRALKESFISCRGDLKTAGWPCLLTNRMALGLAGLYFGGKSSDTAPAHHLTVADFQKASQEDMDRWSVAGDDKMEARPRAPTTSAQWVKQGMAEAKVFALVYGWEHLAEREEALRVLERLSDEDPDVFPRFLVGTKSSSGAGARS